MHANIYSFADVIGKSGVLPASARSLNRQVPKQLKARPLCSFVIGWWKHNALLSRQKQSSDARWRQHRERTSRAAQFMAMLPMLLVMVTRVALARSSLVASARQSSRFIFPKLRNTSSWYSILCLQVNNLRRATLQMQKRECSKLLCNKKRQRQGFLGIFRNRRCASKRLGTDTAIVVKPSLETRKNLQQNNQALLTTRARSIRLFELVAISFYFSSPITNSFALLKSQSKGAATGSKPTHKKWPTLINVKMHRAFVFLRKILISY